MQRPQLELWSAEPHPTPQTHQELTAQQRSEIVSRLAQLILKMVQELPANPSTPTTPDSHER